MAATSFAAGNPVLNTTLDEGHRLLALCFADPAVGAGALFVNPVASGPAGGLIAEADFASNGVPTDGTPIYLQLQIPNNSQFTDTYDVALVLYQVDTGEALTDALK